MIQKTLRGTLRKSGPPQQSYTLERIENGLIACNDINDFLNECLDDMGAMVEIRVRKIVAR